MDTQAKYLPAVSSIPSASSAFWLPCRALNFCAEVRARLWGKAGCPGWRPSWWGVNAASLLRGHQEGSLRSSSFANILL